MEGHRVPVAPGNRGAVSLRDKIGLGDIDLRLLKAAVEATGEAILITSAELDEPGPRIEYPNGAFLRGSAIQPVQ